MDNQPKSFENASHDATVSCSRCKYVRIVPSVQNPLEKVLVCFFLPPTPMLAMTQHGPMLMPSTHSPVMANDWCFQFKRAENLSELSSTGAPKLLESDGKSILNG